MQRQRNIDVYNQLYNCLDFLVTLTNMNDEEGDWILVY